MRPGQATPHAVSEGRASSGEKNLVFGMSERAGWRGPTVSPAERARIGAKAPADGANSLYLLLPRSMAMAFDGMI
jgi:hypothetical protein